MFFVGFLLLRSKVKADAINDLQYCEAKRVTNSDMFVKYERNTSTKTGGLEKLHHNITEKGKFKRRFP